MCTPFLHAHASLKQCPAALAEVVPFGGKVPTLGTNPHSWGFPTTDTLGFPVVVDWATSVIAMGRVQQLSREGSELPSDAAVDSDGNVTTDPEAVAALMPFGRHKGYGLSLIDELYAAYIGGGPPTLRHRDKFEGEKQCCTFYFHAIHPEALDCGRLDVLMPAFFGLILLLHKLILCELVSTD